MVEYTRTMLAQHIVKAMSYTGALIGALSVGVWFFLGSDAAIAVWDTTTTDTTTTDTTTTDTTTSDTTTSDTTTKGGYYYGYYYC